jgi:hypothetical protein
MKSACFFSTNLVYKVKKILKLAMVTFFALPQFRVGNANMDISLRCMLLLLLILSVESIVIFLSSFR